MKLKSRDTAKDTYRTVIKLNSKFQILNWIGKTEEKQTFLYVKIGNTLVSLLLIDFGGWFLDMLYNFLDMLWNFVFAILAPQHPLFQI